MIRFVECGCDKWDKNLSIIDGSLELAGNHGFNSKVDVFMYCPYCGKKRVMIEVESGNECKEDLFIDKNEILSEDEEKGK